MRSTPLFVAGIACVAALLPAAAAAQSSTFTPIPPPGSAGAPPVLRARPADRLYRANCATCHGEAGLGGLTSWIDPSRTAPPIAGYSPLALPGHVRAGHPPAMPAFPEQAISTLELARLAQYVAGLPATKVPPPPAAVTIQVLDEDPWFSPLQVTVQPGDIVRFVNAGATYHPVIELDWLLTSGMRGSNSGPLGPGGSFEMRWGAPGVHTVLCGIHPYMRAEVHVGQSFTPPAYSVNTPAPPPAIPGVGEVWVCAQFQDWGGKSKDGVVQVIDAATWSVTHLIPVGNNPHNIWFGAGSTEALVTNWFDSTVSRIDAATKSLTGSACVAGAAAAHVTSDYDGYYWYVTIEGSNYLQRFSQGPGPWSLCSGSGAYPQLASLSGWGPHGIWYAGGKLVAANSMDSTVSIVDTTTMQETAFLPAGMMPLGAAASRDGRYAATGNAMGASVSIYDLVNEEYVRDIPLAYGAIQVPFTPDSRYICAAGGSTVTVIDAAKAADPIGWPNPADAIVATIWTGNGAHGVAFGRKAGGGGYAYVTHKFENYVSVIDLATFVKAGDVPLALTTTGKVALAGATDTGGNGIAVWPNPAPWH